MAKVAPEIVADGNGQVDVDSLRVSAISDEPKQPNGSEVAPSVPIGPPIADRMEVKPLPNAPDILASKGGDWTAVFGLLLLPITWPLVVVTTLLSWPSKVTRNCVTCRCAIGLFFFFMGPVLILLAAFMALIGAWGFVMQMATEIDLILLKTLLVWIPWPGGSDSKLFHCACSRQSTQIEKMTGLKDLEPESEKVRRRLAVVCWRNISFHAGWMHPDDEKGHLTDMIEGGGDVNFPDASGKSFLYAMARGSTSDIDAVDYLLTQSVDPNMQEGGKGYAPLHVTTSEDVYTKLRNFDGSGNIAGTDLSLMSIGGETPYMKQGSEHNFFQPNPSWDELEKVLDIKDAVESDDVEDLCDRIVDLIAEKNNGCRSLRLLCVLDMLFCEHEGDSITLKSRRIKLFQKFLRPAMSRSVEGRMNKEHHDLLMQIYKGLKGPPGCRGARAGFAAEYKKAVGDACAKIEGMYSVARDELLQSCICSQLFDIPKKMQYLEELQQIPALMPFTNADVLFQGRFTAPPKFAFSRDLSQAALELQNAGAIGSADAFCDLIQQGRHRFLRHARPKLFSNRSSIQFWQALVMLWSIGVQEQLLDAFNTEMRSIATGAELRTAPVKGFDRSFEKAEEYAAEKKLKKKGWNAEVLAPLHVIDVLRCSFIVDSIESNLEIGQRLQAKFAIARTKNTHSRDNASYADRKFNLVFEKNGVAAVCEVQVLMKRYIEIKEFGHLIYEFVR